VRTVEAGGDNVREVSTIYCPHVGIVALDMEDLRGVHRVARLRSHGPRIDVVTEKAPSAGGP
jgi:hypothetical protein